MLETPKVSLLYDGECPVCRAYSRMVRIREGFGGLDLVDARHPSSLRDEVTAQGLDIDEGMVLRLNGRLYAGADAVHMLAMISTRSGVFNRLTYWLFGTPRASAMLYPILRAGRNFLLRLLGKSRIKNLKVDH